MPRRLTTVLFVLTTYFLSIAGEPFHGIIFNYRGIQVAGAKVYLRNQKEFVKSNKSGVFILDGVEPDDTLHIKYRGRVYDIAVEGTRGMSIKLEKEPVKGGNERINLGQGGSMRLSDYNGSYCKMNAEQLEATGATLIVDALRSMPGVVVVGNKVSVRASKWNPLWIIDGFEADPYLLTVMEVDNIVVLKDGMMYGSRGAGGVIVVTTKGSDF